MKSAESKPKKKKRVPNPNKVNQHTGPDPRQTLFLQYYNDPDGDTFSNAYKSALKAKYSNSIARRIVAPSFGLNWIAENERFMNERRKRLAFKAERNLEEFLDMDIMTQKQVGDDIIEVKDSQLAKVKQDTSKFVSERLNKKVYGNENKTFNAFQFNIGNDKDEYQ